MQLKCGEIKEGGGLFGVECLAPVNRARGGDKVHGGFLCGSCEECVKVGELTRRLGEMLT